VSTSIDPVVVIGDFDSPTRARRAMVALEAQHVDADDIHLAEPPEAPVPDAQRTAEGRMAGAVVGRSLVGAIVGGIVAALIFGGVAWIAGLRPMGLVIVIGLVGGILGFNLGGFWGGASRLPVNEEAFDTYALDPDRAEPVHVEVRARDAATAVMVESVLEAHDATSIRRQPA
jgi:hypothetical protein